MEAASVTRSQKKAGKRKKEVIIIIYIYSNKRI